jgi:hypothetical protein
MRPLAFDVGNETDAAGVVLVVRVVQAIAREGVDFVLGSRLFGEVAHGHLHRSGSAGEFNSVPHRLQAHLNGVGDK